MAPDVCADCGDAHWCLQLRSKIGNKTSDGSGRLLCPECAAFRRERYHERGT